LTPFRICLTFDIDLVGHAAGGSAVDEFGEAVPRIVAMFDKYPAWKATWFVRLDDQIAALLGVPTAIWERHATTLSEVRSRGHEVGWHPHSYVRSDSGKWRQNTDEASVVDELSRLAPAALALGCRAVRCGWGFHTNQTMHAVSAAGFAIDSSAIPRPRYQWETSVKDWTTTPPAPYHPSAADYRVPGAPALPILEVPMSVAVVRAPTDTERVVRYVNPSFHQPLFTSALATQLNSLDHVVTVTHPYEIVPNGTVDSLIAYDAGTLETNIRFIEQQAERAGRQATFVTLSELAAAGDWND
jgi:hypothetical protein